MSICYCSEDPNRPVQPRLLGGQEGQGEETVKRIGDTGQLSVGKALAGRLVRLEPAPDGVMLRFVVDVPEKDAWGAREPYKSKLKSALAWAGKNPSPETDLGALLARVKPDASIATKRTKKAKSSKRAKCTGYGNGQSPGWD